MSPLRAAGALLITGPIAGALVACAGSSPEPGVPARVEAEPPDGTSASAVPRPESGPAAAGPERDRPVNAAPAAPPLVIENLDDGPAAPAGSAGAPARVHLAAQLDGCRAVLRVEAARMRWRAEGPGEPPASCRVLAPVLRPAWIALADAARQRSPLPRQLGLVIDLRGDLPSVESWFRYQSDRPELQRLATAAGDAAYNRQLAEHLMGSGALGRFEDLLRAMGWRISGVSLEKVEVLPAGRWPEHLPEAAGWGLEAQSQLALPNLTWLDLELDSELDGKTGVSSAGSRSGLSE